MRLAIQVFSGSPVIQRVAALYVVLSVEVTIAVPVHHGDNAQNIAGRVAVIVRWSAIWAGISRDLWRRKLRLPSVWLPRAAAVAAWCRKMRDSSMQLRRYLIRRAGVMVVLITLGG